MARRTLTSTPPSPVRPENVQHTATWSATREQAAERQREGRKKGGGDRRSEEYRSSADRRESDSEPAEPVDPSSTSEGKAAQERPVSRFRPPPPWDTGRPEISRERALPWGSWSTGIARDETGRRADRPPRHGPGAAGGGPGSTT